MGKFLDQNGLALFWTKIKNFFVPKSRKINNKTLDSDIILISSDVGAAADNHTHIDYVPLSGGTMTGTLTASVDANYTTYKVRNIALTTSAAVPTGIGNILGVYK